MSHVQSDNVQFSRHALNRIDQRLRITKSELQSILNSGSTIQIGSETGSNRVHRLFYSIRDNQCFVVVQDHKTQTVITVLPIDYHNNIAWIVSIESQREAKALIVPERINKKLPERINKKLPERFVVRGTLLDPYGAHIKIVNLCKFDAINYDYCMLRLVQCSRFKDIIKEHISKHIKTVHNSEAMILQICIGFGKSNNVIFDLDQIL